MYLYTEYIADIRVYITVPDISSHIYLNIIRLTTQIFVINISLDSRICLQCINAHLFLFSLDILLVRACMSTFHRVSRTSPIVSDVQSRSRSRSAFNGCRRQERVRKEEEKEARRGRRGRRDTRRRRGRRGRPPRAGDGGTGGQKREREDELERGAAWYRSGGRVTRDDGGVNTLVISLKCTWMQPRAEVRCYRYSVPERERERETELYRARNRVARENIDDFFPRGYFNLARHNYPFGL